MLGGPKTRAEFEKKRYGVWTAGGQKGHAYDPSRCAEEISTNERWPKRHQCSRPSGHGPEGLYCRQHDPAAVEARDKERRRRDDESWERERPKWYAKEMLGIIRQISTGHNDPRSLCVEFLNRYDKPD